jgi:hypothetical protein
MPPRLHVWLAGIRRRLLLFDFGPLAVVFLRLVAPPACCRVQNFQRSPQANSRDKNPPCPRLGYEGSGEGRRKFPICPLHNRTIRLVQTTKTAGTNRLTLACRLASSASPSEIRRRNAEMQSPVPKPPHLSDLLVHVNVNQPAGLAVCDPAPPKTTTEAFLAQKMVISRALERRFPSRPTRSCPSRFCSERGAGPPNRGCTALSPTGGRGGDCSLTPTSSPKNTLSAIERAGVEVDARFVDSGLPLGSLSERVR